jgi:hypothetical protein
MKLKYVLVPRGGQGEDTLKELKDCEHCAPFACLHANRVSLLCCKQGTCGDL